MTTKHNHTYHNTPFDAMPPKVVCNAKTEIKEAKMTYKTLIATILIASSLAVAGEVQAKPDMTAEQLAKARETAQQMKPPVDLDALFTEADRLGVKCEGDLTTRIVIKTCKGNVEIAQSKERQAQSKERQAKLREDNQKLREEIADIVDETKRIANEKLNKK